MVGVEQWAEVRRLRFVRGLSIREIHRRTGLHRDTIRRAISSDEPPCYRRASAGSKLDPFKDEIHRLLKDDPALPGQRIRELIEPLGFDGGKTIVDDYLREVRPLFRDAADVSADGLSAGGDLPVRCVGAAGGGPGRARPDPQGLGRGGVPGLLARGRGRAGLHPSRPRICCSGSVAVCGRWARCRRRWSGIASRGCTPRGGRPTVEFAAFCGALRVDWHFCEPRDPQAKGVVERLQDFMERSFEPGRALRQRARLPAAARRLVRPPRQPARSQDAALPPDRPAPRGARGDGAAAAGGRPTSIAAGCCGCRPTPICALTPATTRSTRGWSAGAVEVRVTDREVPAVALDTGELACRHQRGRSLATARSPRSSTPARSRPSASSAEADARARRSRSARWPAMTS